ncbi:efflux RND transporter periplasmic adaptor subunit [Rahnella sp. LAC-M12]|uniref:Efflux RND transporter periplasmic adaptor subunit n=2 Tax=Yersiniaceae TaxID=1903411 RepID=A0ABS0DZY9_9GAMM|nr:MULTISPECIES: efflux RND transporter periplasmic adaptor subunit [Rahnella]MBF7978372.1 efflux RND transporter periplasmic adaptor subunit [Rahnella laticis]MBF7997911.1 efflux RND transporter periplasmic adaptor subunit [Rahnella sp. LAC-M12]
MNIKWTGKARAKILLLLCILLACGVAAFVYQSQSEPHVLTRSETVTKGDIQNTVITTGTLKPVSQISVGAQVNGQLKKLYVRQGDVVKKGQLLAEIDPVLQQNELRKSEAELSSAKAQFSSAQIQLIQYKLALRRQKKMGEEGSGIQSDLEAAQSQFDSQTEQVKVNEAQIVQAEMAVETARANVGFTRLTAPIEGEVLGIVTQEGQTIVSSQTAPTILVLADLSKMRIQTRISETDILKVKSGQPLWFYVLAQPDQRYDTVMGEIKNAPDDVLNNSGDSSVISQPASAIYYSGVFEISNSEHLLKTAMTAQVFIVVKEAKNVLRVPLSALTKSNKPEQYEVTVIQGTKKVSRNIEIGVRDNNFAEVKKGLSEGDQIQISQLPLENSADE